MTAQATKEPKQQELTLHEKAIQLINLEDQISEVYRSIEPLQKRRNQLCRELVHQVQDGTYYVGGGLFLIIDGDGFADVSISRAKPLPSRPNRVDEPPKTLAADDGLLIVDDAEEGWGPNAWGADDIATLAGGDGGNAIEPDVQAESGEGAPPETHF